jgi:hypothetical protein
MFAVLEKIPGLAASAFEWRGALGETAPAAMRFLKPTGGFAAAVRCPHGCGCAHEIVSVEPGRRAAVCVCENAGGCDDFEPATRELEILELDVPRLGRDIVTALECRPAFTRLPPPRTWQIGAWSAVAVPVVLTIQAHPADLRRVAIDLSARLRSAFILLTPTAVAIDASLLEVLAASQSAVFALNNLLRLPDSGRLEPTRTPGAVFRAFTTAAPELEEDAARNVFALIRQLESDSPATPPTVLTVFREYCIEGRAAAEIARRLRCSKTTVIERLGRIRRVTGTDPARFRQMASYLEKIERNLSDSRAKNIHRSSAM